MFLKVFSYTFFLLFFFYFSTSTAQQPNPLLAKNTKLQKIWVDSVMTTMTLDEKIGQLFMIAAYANKDNNHIETVKKHIQKNKVGGLIFMQGDPKNHVLLNNYYQSISKTPLIISIDAEWGLDMRVTETFKYPWNMTLGAISNNKLIEAFGKQLGKHCKRMGFHINFAPVVDINTNPQNPIIGNRSFGESKENVTLKSIAFIKGMQKQGVLATAKHFPGHGDTWQDSHKTLPTITFNKQRIDSVELYPYKKLFENNLASVMTAHLNIPSLEIQNNLPTSLSHNVVTKLLKKKMGFNGLIITDALNMKGATNNNNPGNLELAAFIAGNDILLFSENVEKGIEKIKAAVKKSEKLNNQLNQSVQKILNAKYLVNLHQYKPISTENLSYDLNTLQDKYLKWLLFKYALTLIQNKNNTLPIHNLATEKIAYVKLGDGENKNFVTTLKKYAKVDVIASNSIKNLLSQLKPYTTIIIGYHKSNSNPWKDYKFSSQELEWLLKISKNHKVILSTFASPYSLLDVGNFSSINSVLVGYQNSTEAQEIAAQIIFGAMGSKGKLPVSIGYQFPVGHGIKSKSLGRLAYVPIAEHAGMSTYHLSKLDTIANAIIDAEMTPGLQLLVARKGNVVYQKSFGHHTYNKKRKVKNTDLYDLASLTKILATLPLIIKADEENYIDINHTLGMHLPFLEGTNKDMVTIKDALSHTGKLKGWIPFYIETIDSTTKKPLSKWYQNSKNSKYNIKVTDNLYMDESYLDSVFKRIADFPLREKSGYKYSDLGFHLFKKIIENKYNLPMDKLADLFFYKPLGANLMTYNPTEKIAVDNIVPTEEDNYFRHQLLQGYVHDMGAAMLGGVSGNAGLFANANDVAKIMQLYLQKGTYAKKKYFKPSTFEKYNHRHYENDSIRRGLGFDKPQLDPKIKATCGCVSDKSFGHSGFTGTYAWADPESELVYIFLSNRVHPTMNNKKLVKQDVRTKIQKLVQQAILNE